METTTTIEGVQVTMRLTDKGSVCWSDRWDLLPIGDRDARFGRLFYGPACYGHEETYYLPAMTPEQVRRYEAGRRELVARGIMRASYTQAAADAKFHVANMRGKGLA